VARAPKIVEVCAEGVDRFAVERTDGTPQTVEHSNLQLLRSLGGEIVVGCVVNELGKLVDKGHGARE
jgi:hypothetical protein